MIGIFDKGKNSVNVEPTFTLLSTIRFPPITSANRFEILNPSPVPPNCLEIELFSCVKESKIEFNLFSAIPFPVSLTRILK